MKTPISYQYLYSLSNLTLAWRKARENKNSNSDITDFEKDLEKNLLNLHYELKNKTYKPKPLTTFVLRGPKTRVISKSNFRDRVVHHAIILVIGSMFQKQFIYDSCANQINKGTTFALHRFDKFLRKITNNCKQNAFCLKADIKHYFEEVDHAILMSILSRKIKDENILWLIRQILNNNIVRSGGGERPF
jgi:retron-type reverse transcriptase